MSVSRFRIKAFSCAPAVVVLATVVNAAASDRLLPGACETPNADLSWVVKGGATHSAQTTRVIIAQKAATNIHSMDRISGAQPTEMCLVLLKVPGIPDFSGGYIAHHESPQQHSRSSHQHAAP